MDLALLIIASLGAVAMLVGTIVRRFVPEIVVFLALGVAVGPDGIGLINEDNIASLDLLTQVALGAVIFLIGDRLRLDDLQERRGLLLPINIGQMLLAGVAVFFAVQWAGAQLETSILLALIATESGVLTVTATVKEQRSMGPTTDTLLSSVGVTNVGTALLFGSALPFVLSASGQAGSGLDTALVFGRLIGLSIAIGLAGGWILKLIVRAIETSGELLLVLLVIITGVVGAAVAADGSVVVSTLVAGLYVANAAPWLADRMFAAVRTLEAPIYLVFFVVAGANIHLDELTRVGVIGIAYTLARLFGKVVGGTLGGAITREPVLGFRVGLGLLPHAGMAIALVALVAEQAPDLGGSVTGVVLGSIVVFELSGPIVTRRALRAAGEDNRAQGEGLEVVPEVVPERRFTKVLVPVGGLEVILPRLPFLLDLIGSMRAEMVAVHVSRPGRGVSEEQEPDVLKLVRQVSQERNIICTPVHKVSESVAGAIVAAVRQEGVDLIVMGEPARISLLEPSRWGLVSQRVVRDVDVPVLVYPVDPTDPEKVPRVYLRRARQAALSGDDEEVVHAELATIARAAARQTGDGDSGADPAEEADRAGSDGTDVGEGPEGEPGDADLAESTDGPAGSQEGERARDAAADHTASDDGTGYRSQTGKPPADGEERVGAPEQDTP